MLPLAIHWNVDPIIFHIGSFGLRWYSLGFLLAFLLGYYLLGTMFRHDKVDTKLLDSLVVYLFLAILVGARLGHCLFYEPDYFCTSAHWPEIFLPFNIQTGQFTGYQGLASHGAAIAIIIALWLYNRHYHLNILWILDRLVIVVALGGAFIRLGNLFNSEIYGYETSLPWGFVFERNGETVPKHPTQLYESLSYFIIFVVSYIAYRRHDGKLHNGRLFGWWLVALFGMRFLIEFVKEDQVAFEDGMLFNMGQLLSIPFIIGGLAIVWLSKHNKLPETTFTNNKKQDKK
ncbi:MAG: prolipoprotein diacylglyceryl transferase [Bacteroidales bacterium]|nr:prolipoprotein diacylglyceryl transferase [Bacteroidales bacterium]